MPPHVIPEKQGWAEEARMSKGRMVFHSRLKTECVAEYICYHKAVWPALLDAYRKAGITQVSCFVSGVDLIVYSEVDAAAYRKSRKALSRHPVEVKWQKLMRTLRDPTFKPGPYKEVFHMPERRR
jgi:L-rhamnose mutarotase